MALRDDLLTPIPGANPSGESLRYDPVYDKIKEARREDDDAPQGDWQRERKTADVKAVITLAGDALAIRSKDLQLAAWLTEALLRQQGFSGLRQGLDLQRGLIENFWDTLYPEIDEGDLDFRAAPLAWVGTKLDGPLRRAPLTRGGFGYYVYQDSRRVGYEDQADTESRREERAAKIADGKIAPEDFDKDSAATPIETYEGWVAALDGCLESLKCLDQVCDEKFGRTSPGFSTLRVAVEEVRHVANQLLQKRLEQEGRAPARDEGEQTSQEPVAEAIASEAAPRRAAPVHKAAAGNLEPADAEDAAARLAAVAKFLRAQDASSPAPYLLLRGYRWGELRGYGESPDAAALEAPSSEVRQNLRRLSLEANWSELLEAAESAMAQPCGRAWLDLQRYVVRAAEGYGYNTVAQAVKSELRALLSDLPQLPHWTLMDDTPTANAETQAFLKELIVPVTSDDVGLPPASRDMEPSAEEDEPGLPDTYTLALKAARGGHAGDAIQLLSDEIARQQSGRARFQRKLQLAQICMMTGYEALAQPILEELAATISSHRLEEWETASSVAHPLALLYRCLRKLDGDTASKQKLYAQISRLDPMQALECER